MANDELHCFPFFRCTSFRKLVLQVGTNKNEYHHRITGISDFFRISINLITTLIRGRPIDSTFYTQAFSIYSLIKRKKKIDSAA